MAEETTAVDATVVESNPAVEGILSQKANFTAQLEQVKKEMVSLQQQFETLKIKGTKLEGALESLDILHKSLSK
jgi:hypothetical protein